MKELGVGHVLIYRSRSSVERFIILGLGEDNCRIISIGYNRGTVRTFSERGNEFSVTLLSVVVPNVSNFKIYGTLHRHSSALNIVVLSTGDRRVSGISDLVVNTSSCVAGPFSVSRLVTEISTMCHEIDHSSDEGRGRRLVASKPFTVSVGDEILIGGNGPISLARIRFRVVRCFLGGPGATLSEISVLRRV